MASVHCEKNIRGGGKKTIKKKKKQAVILVALGSRSRLMWLKMKEKDTAKGEWSEGVKGSG